VRPEQPSRLSHADEVKRILDKADFAESDEGSAISLSDVRVVWSSSDGVKIPTLRLNPGGRRSVVARKDRNAIQGKESGAFIGVAIPLG
jgi:hypothetical protein